VILYFLRHAIAMDKGEWKGADSDRPLTKEGSRKMKKAAKGIRRLDLKIDWILTSPYRRTYDTAIIAAKELKLKNKVKVSRSLAADGDPKTFVRHLAQNFRTWESVLLVGHEPYFTGLINVLIAGQGKVKLVLDKGGLAKLIADTPVFDKCARLEWLLTPKILKKLI